MSTVLVTGGSSGYGRETVEFFHRRGWNVIFTSTQSANDVLCPSGRLRQIRLDVTDETSVANAISEAGPVDLLVNNAGIAAFGPCEALPLRTVREVFDTNTFGVIAVTSAVLPEMKRRRCGTIVNISGAPRGIPLVSAYASSKRAVEGFSRYLALEAAAFGCRVKVVVPGRCRDTGLVDPCERALQSAVPAAYAATAAPFLEWVLRPKTHTEPTDVANAVWRAAHDTSHRLVFLAGPDAVATENV